MPYFLGIDISTTATKALLADETGRIITVGSAPHTVSHPKPLWSEQDPAEWWQATTIAIQAALHQANTDGSAIAAIGLTGQMHGLVLLNQAGKVLRPTILWNDQRTQPQCDEIHRRIGKEKFIRITGNQALTGFTAPKILWMAENEPEIYQQGRHILLPKDYIRHCLTGDYATDKSDASGTVLFDLKQRDWSIEILETLEIDPAWLPTTFEGPQVTGQVTIAAATVTDLKVGTPVVAGGGDQAAQAVGVGVVELGLVALTVGTSGVVFTPTASPLFEPEGRLHAFCHAVPAMWHFMGVMLSAAGSLQWYRDTLAPGMDFNDLLQEAESVPAGCDGLLFLPYLSGERTPYPDPLARGAFVGLTLRHGRGHLTRAVLEGVAYGLKDSFTLIHAAGLGEIRQVRASGGGTRSALWKQILASVLETELVTVNALEGAAYGAALLAGVGAGCWPDVNSACRAAIEVSAGSSPLPDQVSVYQEGYQHYRMLYPALKPTFT